MKCPRCKTELRQTDCGEVGLVAVDLCPGCRGMWVDEGELDVLDDSVSSNAELLDYQKVEGVEELLDCPRCSDERLLPMTPPEAKELVIDRCESCHGFWLDEGELDKVRELLLNIDSEKSNIEYFSRPPHWSWTKWMLHSLLKTYSKELEVIGQAAQGSPKF
jgi:uncharacterized protein